MKLIVVLEELATLAINPRHNLALTEMLAQLAIIAMVAVVVRQVARLIAVDILLVNAKTVCFCF